MQRVPLDLQRASGFTWPSPKQIQKQREEEEAKERARREMEVGVERRFFTQRPYDEQYDSAVHDSSSGIGGGNSTPRQLTGRKPPLPSQTTTLGYPAVVPGDLIGESLSFSLSLPAQRTVDYDALLLIFFLLS